jgi:alkanesulfonate monooxygenase SsuD/methylene tetrahydromethanopterin reductase-like flavin-dependent oxidoreductase (luciferase family)
VDPAIQRAARLADTWMASFSNPWTELKRANDVYNAARADAGLSAPIERPLCRECFIADTPAKAMEIARDPFIYKCGAYAAWGNKNVTATPFADDFDAFQASRFIIGDKQTAKDQIRWIKENLASDHLVLRMQWPGLPQRDVLRSIKIDGGGPAGD